MTRVPPVIFIDSSDYDRIVALRDDPAVPTPAAVKANQMWHELRARQRLVAVADKLAIPREETKP